jgi:hypothetical protein
MAGLRPSPTQQRAIQQDFRAFINALSFPCVGAKSAVANEKLNIFIGYDITSSWDDVRLQNELMEWAHAYAKAPTLFTSFRRSRPACKGSEAVRLRTQAPSLSWRRLHSARASVPSLPVWVRGLPRWHRRARS